MSIALVIGTTITGPATVSAAVNTTGATLLVMCVSKSSSLASSALISDSQGNTWHALTDVTNGALGHCIWYAWDKGGTPLSTSAAHTFTIGNPNTSGAIISAYSGTQTSSDPFDKQNTNTAAASLTVTTGTVTPSTSGQLLIALVGAQVAATAPFTINSSFTVNAYIVGAAGAVQAVGGAYFIQTVAAAINPTWTVGGASNLTAAIASFKASAGVAAVQQQLGLLGCGS